MLRFIQFKLIGHIQIALIIAITSGIPLSGLAQIQQESDEIPVLFHDKYLGATEIQSIIQNEIAFLSIHEVFSFLRIPCHYSQGGDSLSGFIHNPKDIFLIDLLQHQIHYNNQGYPIQGNDILRFNDQVFLKFDLFGALFGLECTFNIRDLSVSMISKTQLPVVKMMILEEKRKHFRMSELSFFPDTVIRRKNKLFHFGTADWSINATEYSNSISHVRLGLSVGTTLAGGELKTLLTHTFNRPFSEKQQHYLWRYANNNSKLVSQVWAGKISPQTISTIVDPIIGLQVSNAPSYVRKSFGTYSAVDMIIPNSLVEIYINNTLINYAQSDASGMVSYEIPLTYGTTDLKLRYYGPNGEEQIIVKKYIIPLAFLPSNEFQYKVSSGIVEDGQGTFYTQGRINYGLSDQITIGGGMEYTSSNHLIQNLPFINASIKLGSDMFVTGEYVSRVRYKTSLIYQTPSRLQFEFNYTKYDENQEAVRYNYVENRNVTISWPFRFSKSSLFTRMSFNQNFLGSQIQNNLQVQFSLSTSKFNINVTNYANYGKGKTSKIYGLISSSVQLPARFRFTTRLNYDYTDMDKGSITLGVEKNFSTSFSAYISFEDKFDKKGQYLRLGFQTNLPFGRVNSNITLNNVNSIYHQSGAGSIVYDKRLRYLKFTKHSMIGKGGVAFISFIDLNANGTRDNNENLIKGLNVIPDKGAGKKIQTDSSVIITGLEPHISYGFRADGNYFENISWQISNPLLSVTIEPNQITLVEIPVVPMGEVAGIVVFMMNDFTKKMNRIKINIYDRNSNVVASALTEDDGYFNYLGLKPGQYTAGIDAEYSNNLRGKIQPELISFTILENIDGDIVDDLIFEVAD